MKYIDLHCDTLTECVKLGESLYDGNLQTSLKNLRADGCAAQCFAVFTRGESQLDIYEKSVALFDATLKKFSGFLMVESCEQLVYCLENDVTGGILTLENLPLASLDKEKLTAFKAAGVKMASLVWNEENAFARPNLCPPENVKPSSLAQNHGGTPAWLKKRNTAGLTAAGREALEILDGLKIIVDISHLSDGGVDEVLGFGKVPRVASHSNADAVHNVSRNLTDAQIKKIADGGGVVGINFCTDFLGSDDTFAAVARHAKHIMNVGGEDVLAFGSDFDGIPPVAGLENCQKMPALIEYLSAQIGFSALEKMAYKNFIRVFAHVCG